MPAIPSCATSRGDVSHSLFLRHVQWHRADGTALWAEPLNASLAHARIGLVGRNGVGKSVLARLLAGQMRPSSGATGCAAPVRLVQPAPLPTEACAADLAHLGHCFRALDRIERGQANAADWAAVTDAEAWRWPARWAQALARAAVPPIAPLHPAHALSIGQQQRVRLALAFARSEPHAWLVLDEPTHALDAPSRTAFRRQLAAWPGAALVISHDRALLDDMAQIAELTAQGLRLFGGSHAAWAAQCDAEEAQAEAAFAHAQAERRRLTRALAAQHDAQQRRLAQAARGAAVANLPKPLLARRQDAASAHDGRAQARRAAQHAQAVEQVHEAAARVERDKAHELALPASQMPAGRVWLRLEALRLPWPLHAPALDVRLAGPCRVALVGPNGAGKSTLLRVIAGHLAPASGRCHVAAHTAWLDQDLSQVLPPDASVRAVMAARGSLLPDSEWRTRMAQLGLGSACLSRPSGQLSSGQRLKAALCCVLWSGAPPQALLLDEPTNPLDLASVRAFEAALTGWPGALIVASHDEAFLAALRLTETLALPG